MSNAFKAFLGSLVIAVALASAPVPAFAKARGHHSAHVHKKHKKKHTKSAHKKKHGKHRLAKKKGKGKKRA